MEKRKDPPPQTIRKLCRDIQEGWSEETRRQRMTAWTKFLYWTPPEIPALGPRREIPRND